MRTMILLLLAASLGSAQDSKAYEIKRYKPAAGLKSSHAESESRNMKISMSGQPAMAMSQATSSASQEEILKVDGEQVVESKWVVSKATKVEGGETLTRGIQGKTVVMTHEKGKARTFAYEDGKPLSDDDLEAMREIAGKSGGGSDGKPAVEDLLLPKRPVKVGESWSPEFRSLVTAMFDEMAQAIDESKSKIVFTLKSVETRGGAEFGKIEGQMDLCMTSFGPLQLDTPVMMALKLEADACIDGKLPDNDLTMKLDMKGKSTTTAEGNKIEIDVDMTMSGQKSQKTVR